MNRLKGYQHPNDIEGGNTPPFQRFEEAPRRSLLYRQLFGGSRFASFTYLTAIAMIATFVYELIRNTQLTGSAIQTSPFNPMVGPNYMALVNMGSKFDPCMRSIPSYSASTSISNCYASTESTCTIEELCGFGGFQGGTPNQSFRFFTSIFLHAGIVHILMNLITHFSLGSDIERILGSIRYAILYLGSGVFGFVLSALLAGPTVSSMGCSGALFGIVGFTVVDLLFRWRETKRPGRELAQLLFVVVVSLVLGLLPGLDNFAHIGGLVMGLLLGTLLSSIRSTASARAKMITWICKVISLVLIVVLFIVVLQAFYQASDLSAVCPGCKYLSCLPVNGWCDV
ncbi:rhomboid family-domain-containing protein [Gilbertella persicaria]|uniref:rhomboid family-domain-containing protein n=1 Tax=Gilbertella persicaria TaxID=101096 RepID=UPI00221EF1D4|nr:rhomboid family-domain-containing protein [Gilbertella persicaria]KAI8076655.1 rhomboid family-domain-containing protein [Gilbertella persicaria]